MDFLELNNSLAPLDEAAATDSKARWDSIAKPLGSLGLLESAVTKIAGLTGSADVALRRRGVLVLCADNGVVCEGVTQSGQEITALVAGNMTRGETSVCRMAACAHADVIPVDMGMRYKAPGVLDRSIAPGTRNMAEEPAMSREQTERAIHTGMELVREARSSGYDILATGEMGIGNTTSSSALCSVLLGLSVEEVTGRGAGLSDVGLSRKRSAIIRAMEVNQPDPEDALDVLSKLGGFDIAGLAGVFLGGAKYRVPILIDGFISAISALVAVRLCPRAEVAMLASHVSAEPAAKLILEALHLKPLLCAEMRLGEGTGAVCALPLLDMALAVYGGMSTFDQIGIEAYKPLGGNPA